MSIKKIEYFFIFGIIILFFPSCIYYPTHKKIYSNNDFPLYTKNKNIWSYYDEKKFMEFQINDHIPENITLPKKKRNIETASKYYIGGALFYAYIDEYNYIGSEAGNPVGVTLVVYGVPDKNISFTVKNIKVFSRSSEDYSYLLSNIFPITVELEEVEYYNQLLPKMPFYGIFKTERIFEFKNEPITLEFILEVNGFDGIEMGVITVNLEPSEKKSLFELID